MTAVDTLAFIARYNYEESMPGAEGQAKDPTWAVAYGLIAPAAHARHIKR